MTKFTDLGLCEPVLRAVAAEGYEIPTPIQAQSIPHLLTGRDLMGIAQTGTGKTAAFALPMLHRLAAADIRPRPKQVRALILSPTRELAMQIFDGFRTYGRNLRLRSAVVFGGVGMVPQIKTLAGGVDILVATPGRLLDLIQQRHVSLDTVEVFVLDEADRMLDMGFIHDVRRIVRCLPTRRQTLLFSATMPATVMELAESVLADYERVEVTPVATTAERVEQKVLFVARGDKPKLLVDLLSRDEHQRTIIFTRTKHGANRIAEYLNNAGLGAEAIHGNKSQNARQKALTEFKAGRVKALVATDIAARGIDIDGVSHVINYDLPNEPESYVHRIGRTGRAGAAGIALSFCDAEEIAYLKAIERTTRTSAQIDDSHGFHCGRTADLHRQPGRGPKPPPRQQQGRPGGQAGRGAKPAAPHHAGKPAHAGHSKPAGGARPAGRPGGGGGQRRQAAG